MFKYLRMQMDSVHVSCLSSRRPSFAVLWFWIYNTPPPRLLFCLVCVVCDSSDQHLCPRSPCAGLPPPILQARRGVGGVGARCHLSRSLSQLFSPDSNLWPVVKTVQSEGGGGTGRGTGTGITKLQNNNYTIFVNFLLTYFIFSHCAHSIKIR